MSHSTKTDSKRAAFRNASPPSLELPIEELLAHVSPQVTLKEAKRRAQVGELQMALTNIWLHSGHGCTHILFNVHYGTTLDELVRRGFELELHDKQLGWLISWEDLASLDEVMGVATLPSEADEAPKADGP